MPAKLKLSLVQMKIEAGNPDTNYRNALTKLKEAALADPKPDVIMLPEMWNTGYELNRIDELADSEGKRTRMELSAFSQSYSVNIIGGSVAEKQEQHVLNTLRAFGRSGEEIGHYSKIHLFKLMDEHLHLASGKEPGLFELEGYPAAAMICYDIRFPELARQLALRGAKILFVPAEWPHPRLHHWRTLLQARAIENQMYVVACNTVGISGKSDFFGHSMVIDPWGEVIAEAGEQEEILTADIDLALVDEVRGRIPVFADRRPEIY